MPCSHSEDNLSVMKGGHLSTWVTKFVCNSELDLQHQRRHKSGGIWMLEGTLKTAKKSFEGRSGTHMFLGCEDYVSISWFCEIRGPLVTK